MKFTVTSGAGVTEIVDRPESAKAALEHILGLLGRKRNDVRISDEDLASNSGGSVPAGSLRSCDAAR
jgi:hypothetical protein